MARTVALLLGLTLTFVMGFSGNALSAGNDLVIADFEKWPNNLGGQMGVYGSLEPKWEDKATVPYSWVYEPGVPSYSKDKVHGGRQSFRLVNGLGANAAESWGSFGMDMGRVTDAVPVPVKVESKDVSGYKYLTFWVRGEKGGEHMEVTFRDANAVSYMPQYKYPVADATSAWQRVVIPLDKIKGKVDLTALDNISIAFGPDVGNEKGATIYLDDFGFTNNL